MKCPSCDAELPDRAKYCINCGSKITFINSGMKDSVAVDSPGAGSVYAPVNILSNKGEKKKYCPSCDNLINENNIKLTCTECSTVFCAICEGFFRSDRQRGKRPFCSDCFEEDHDNADTSESKPRKVKIRKSPPKALECPYCDGTGKEANNLEEANVLGVGGDSYVHYYSKREYYGNMSAEEGREKGVSRQRRYYWRNH